MRFLFISMQFNKPSNARFVDRRSIEKDLKYLQKSFENQRYLLAFETDFRRSLFQIHLGGN